MARFAIIQDGTVVNIVEAEASFAAEQGWVDPHGAGIGWLYDGTSFTAPPPTIVPIETIIDAIKTERDRRKFVGVKVGADWFHCDLESRSQWERMANKAYQLGLTGVDAYTIGGQPVPWKTMTGTFVVLTAGKIFAVVDTIELQEALIFGRAQQHITAVQSSATPESYDFSTGWPVSFEDGV